MYSLLNQLKNISLGGDDAEESPQGRLEQELGVDSLELGRPHDRGR